MREEAVDLLCGELTLEGAVDQSWDRLCRELNMLYTIVCCAMRWVFEGDN